jgi:hypothetical protein
MTRIVTVVADLIQKPHMKIISSPPLCKYPRGMCWPAQRKSGYKVRQTGTCKQVPTSVPELCCCTYCCCMHTVKKRCLYKPACMLHAQTTQPRLRQPKKPALSSAHKATLQTQHNRDCTQHRFETKLPTTSCQQTEAWTG